MPEHIHLLVTEPEQTPLATALMALKISSSKRLDPSPFWQPRYYDFNIYTANKRVEKLRYIHETLFDAGW
jgi:putative transposase